MALDVSTAAALGHSGGRRLKTATETLRALWILGAASEGLSVEHLAFELGKSKETARYLLNTLCQEGFAQKDRVSGSYCLAPTPPWARVWGEPETGVDLPASLGESLDELYGRTHERSYLARLENETTSIIDARGRQGLPRIPGLGEQISPTEAHALAVSKALVAQSPDHESSLRDQPDLKPFTDATITELDAFGVELARVRHDGYALDREEFADNFCCIAAPIFDPGGRVAASLGISVLARRFAADSPALISEVVDAAARASEEWRRRAAASAVEEACAPDSPQEVHSEYRNSDSDQGSSSTTQ